jgi:O-phosphoseryl-tRNA(Cys) synthetase
MFLYADDPLPGMSSTNVWIVVISALVTIITTIATTMGTVLVAYYNLKMKIVDNTKKTEDNFREIKVAQTSVEEVKGMATTAAKKAEAALSKSTENATTTDAIHEKTSNIQVQLEEAKMMLAGIFKRKPPDQTGDR